MTTFARQLEEWDGLAVVTRHDPESGSWIFIALHDDSLGTPVGGTRCKVYPSPADGIRDAQRLAAGMTSKWAGVELPFGGGKAVLALCRELDPEARRRLFRRYGEVLGVLGGSFQTGQDLGMTPDDMLEVARVSGHVHGVDPETGRTVDAGPYTARGVLAAMRATLRELEREGRASASLAEATVWIEGVGDVGAPLARRLAEAGARIRITDLDPERARRVAREVDGEVVGSEAGLRSPVTVYAPCAVGATLNESTIRELRALAVCGAANNQLAEPQDAERLASKGILYAPDYLANGGGAIAFGLRSQGVTDESSLAERVDRIEGILSEVFADARARGGPPATAADRRVARILAEARRARGRI